MVVTNPSEGYMSFIGKGSRTSIENLVFGQIQTQIEDIDEKFIIESKPKVFAEKAASCK